MLILQAGNIKKYFSDRLIFEFDEIKVYTGDRIGIVGQNGAGKTTLLNILAGELAPDEGFVRCYSDIAYIRQFSDEDMDADRKVLSEFNLLHKSQQRVFSGGEKTRIKIANALSNEKLLIMADEPTANLDFKGVELLRQKLSTIDTFIIISHDRELLNSLCNKILDIRDGRLRSYDGNYSFYEEQRAMEYERAGLEYEKYIAEKASLEDAIVDRRGRAKAMKKTPTRMGNSEARLHKRSTTERQEKINSAVNSLKTRLSKLEEKEKPRELPEIKLDFSMTNPPENKIVISASKLNFSYGDNEIFKNAEFRIPNGRKTALWGENGTGKSTLLNLVSGNSCKDIYIVPKARIGYFWQGFENLNYDKTVLENVMEDSVQTQTVTRTILARLLISGDDVYKKVGYLSGGEKIKVSFAKLFVSNANVLLLDEPTNYLDMPSIKALENVLANYEGTVLFVSHDSAFVNSVADRLLIFENKQIKEFEGNLKAYKSSMEKPKSVSMSEMERTILQMRITEVVSKMPGASDKDKEVLEAEYQQLIGKLK